jgi:hypothetical protein
MKLRVQTVMDATIILTRIINQQRPMPQVGKYRVARLHARLLPEFNVIDARRDEMIKAYDTPQTKKVTLPETGAEAEVPADGWKVPDDKMPEFTEAWKLIGAEEIDVDVQPIALSCLSLGNDTDGSIEAGELLTLGDLISE